MVGNLARLARDPSQYIDQSFCPYASNMSELTYEVRTTHTYTPIPAKKFGANTEQANGHTYTLLRHDSS